MTLRLLILLVLDVLGAHRAPVAALLCVLAVYVYVRFVAQGEDSDA